MAQDKTIAMFWHDVLGCVAYRLEDDDIQIYRMSQMTEADTRDPELMHELAHVLNASQAMDEVYVWCPDTFCDSCGEVFDVVVPDGDRTTDCPSCGYPVWAEESEE